MQRFSFEDSKESRHNLSLSSRGKFSRTSGNVNVGNIKTRHWINDTIEE